MVDAPPARKRRGGKKRSKLARALESSSSEGEDAPPPTRVALHEPAEAPSDAGSDSSDLFSSEDEAPAQRKGKRKAPASTADDVAPPAPSVDAPPPARRLPPRREKSVSPPPFGFGAPRKPGEPLLYGHVAGDGDTAAVKHHPEYEAFRQFYLDRLVDRFSGELGGLQKEVETPDKLQLLVKSLAGGADLFLADGPASQRDVVLQATAARATATAPVNGDASGSDDDDGMSE